MSKITLKVEVDESMYKRLTSKERYVAVNDCQVYQEWGEFCKAIKHGIPITECDDAISRDMVIKAVDAHTNEDGTLDDDISIILEDLPSVIPKNERNGWILVNERLPEESTSVLVYCPERKSIYCAYLEEKQWWVWEVGEHFQKFPLEIIAWMPLPTSYKP